MTAEQHINDVRAQVAADDKVLKVARERRDAVREAALSFPGAIRTYRSGSVAMGTVNDPVSDADSGVVLDRRVYPDLGPDGNDDPPDNIVCELHDHVGPTIRQTYPGATVHDMKRGLTVKFHDPVIGDQDPYVDLAVALNRKDAPGIWIPNMAASRWDAAHPEKHVELMRSGTDYLRRTRARVVRLAKAWNNQYSEPAFCSFNLVALALEAVTEGKRIDLALADFFEEAVTSLTAGLTADPAGVSGTIKLKTTKDIALKRLKEARDLLQTATTATDEDEILEALHLVFWKYLPEPQPANSRRALKDLISQGSPRISTVSTPAVVGAMKPARAWSRAHVG